MDKAKSAVDERKSLIKVSIIIGTVFSVFGVGVLTYFKFFGIYHDAPQTVYVSTYAELDGLKSRALNDEYYLMGDIDVFDPEFQLDSPSNPFAGKLIGNGHKITYKVPMTNSFISENKGVITGLSIIGSKQGEITDSFGSIATSNKGEIRDCYVNNVINPGSTGPVGGVVGVNEGTIHHVVSKLSFADMFPSSNNYVLGGIAGCNSDSGYIKQCIAYSDFNIPDSEFDKTINANISLANIGLACGIALPDSNIELVSAFWDEKTPCHDVENENIKTYANLDELCEQKYLQEVLEFDFENTWQYGKMPTLKS